MTANMADTMPPEDEAKQMTDIVNTPPHKDVLTEAGEAITGQRLDDYGDVHESFTRIAQLWSAYLNHPINNLDVANMMVLLKVSRAKNKYHRDSYVDICGYAALAEKLRAP
jgi:hypothetical protein